MLSFLRSCSTVCCLRVRYPQAIHQNRVLCIVRYPFSWCVSLSFGPFYLTLMSRVVVRVRSREGRRNRAPPPRVRWKDGKKVNPAVAAAEDAKAQAARGA